MRKAIKSAFQQFFEAKSSAQTLFLKSINLCTYYPTTPKMSLQSGECFSNKKDKKEESFF